MRLLAVNVRLSAPTAPRDTVKTPQGLQALIDDGVIDEVLRPLKSGKEAAVYIVRSGDEIRCAKVYKDMAQRSFQQRVQYQEGRKVRGSREARAIGKASKYGRKQQETAWKNTEVDALYQLVEAGVRVPQPVCGQAGRYTGPRGGGIHHTVDSRDIHVPASGRSVEPAPVPRRVATRDQDKRRCGHGRRPSPP